MRIKSLSTSIREIQRTVGLGRTSLLLMCQAALLAIVVAAAAMAAAGSVSDRARDERTIQRLNDEWLKAYDAGDTQALDRIEDGTFVVSGDFGEVTKQHQLEDVRHRSDKISAVKRTIENQRIRFYGDVALVTEVDHSSVGADSSRYQSSMVWVRSGREWKVVHLHFSQLSERTAGMP